VSAAFYLIQLLRAGLQKALILISVAITQPAFCILPDLPGVIAHELHAVGEQPDGHADRRIGNGFPIRSDGRGEIAGKAPRQIAELHYDAALHQDGAPGGYFALVTNLASILITRCAPNSRVRARCRGG
jgi:hypothetical protein